MKMNISMCVFLCLLITVNISISCVFGAENIYILHAPSYTQFGNSSTEEVLRSSQLPDLISAAVGFTTSQAFNWKGLKAGNPLKKPKAVAVIEFDGFSHIDLALNQQKFPLITDVTSMWSYHVTADRIYGRFQGHELNLLEIVNDNSLYAVKAEYPALLESVAVHPSDLKDHLLSEKSVLRGRPLGYLNVTDTPDLAFLLDVQLLSEVVETLPSKKDLLRANEAVDLFWFSFSSFQDLVSVYGFNSPQATEALAIIRSVLKRSETSYLDVYGDDVLILLLTVDSQVPSVVTRVRRGLADAIQADTNVSYNIAIDYNEDYPAIFNITLFTMLIFSLSVFAISLGTWHMDPGRDSIIYRMTSQRIKKDQ